MIGLHLAAITTPVVRDSYAPLHVSIPVAIALWVVVGVAMWRRSKKVD